MNRGIYQITRGIYLIFRQIITAEKAVTVGPTCTCVHRRTVRSWRTLPLFRSSDGEGKI